jgi:hypothetical protein
VQQISRAWLPKLSLFSYSEINILDIETEPTINWKTLYQRAIFVPLEKDAKLVSRAKTTIKGTQQLFQYPYFISSNTENNVTTYFVWDLSNPSLPLQYPITLPETRFRLFALHNRHPWLAAVDMNLKVYILCYKTGKIVMESEIMTEKQFSEPSIWFEGYMLYVAMLDAGKIRLWVWSLDEESGTCLRKNERLDLTVPPRVANTGRSITFSYTQPLRHSGDSTISTSIYLLLGVNYAKIAEHFLSYLVATQLDIQHSDGTMRAHQLWANDISCQSVVAHHQHDSESILHIQASSGLGGEDHYYAIDSRTGNEVLPAVKIPRLLTINSTTYLNRQQHLIRLMSTEPIDSETTNNNIYARASLVVSLANSTRTEINSMKQLAEEAEGSPRVVGLQYVGPTLVSFYWHSMKFGFCFEWFRWSLGQMKQ